MNKAVQSASLGNDNNQAGGSAHTLYASQLISTTNIAFFSIDSSRDEGNHPRTQAHYLRLMSLAASARVTSYFSRPEHGE